MRVLQAKPGGPKELELLKGITGAFQPGVLTALMGASGAGKTTFMDVLAGRKNSEPLTLHSIPLMARSATRILSPCLTLQGWCVWFRRAVYANCMHIPLRHLLVSAERCCACVRRTVLQFLELLKKVASSLLDPLQRSVSPWP